MQCYILGFFKRKHEEIAEELLKDNKVYTNTRATSKMVFRIADKVIRDLKRVFINAIIVLSLTQNVPAKRG
jgi:RecA/RadA recombinase